NPKINLYANSTYLTSNPRYAPNAFIWGQLPDDPSRDIRLRQAAAMMFDRHLFMETFNFLPELRAEGIDLPYDFHTILSCADDRYWIDPQDMSAIGEGGKNFTYDPDEAAKLFSAMGLSSSDPLTIDFHIATSTTP